MIFHKILRVIEQKYLEITLNYFQIWINKNHIALKLEIVGISCIDLSHH